MQQLSFHHIGIPTERPLPDKYYNKALKLHGAGYFDGPFAIEWHNFDVDNELPSIIKSVPHVGFVVDDVKQFLSDKHTVLEPSEPKGGVTTAFFMDGDALIEVLQFDRPEQEVWPHPAKFRLETASKTVIPLKYHHVGMPTRKRMRNEIHHPHLKMYVSGYGENPYGWEWVRYEDDAAYPDLVKTVPHVCFEVDDLQAALDGRQVIIPPNSPSAGVIAAFIEDNGAPIELIQVDRSIATEGI